ncbi:hypothetical protein EPI10_016441 [Gossypium australe]|uniref:Uncharacterized protein n=1 Tax=Gossypium australe TaxID=47621 RepID=A0A5B6VNQ7_9ROSI|nr:hypothetical protein EPI10_016441 [Gossypium australe]
MSFETPKQAWDKLTRALLGLEKANKLLEDEFSDKKKIVEKVTMIPLRGSRDIIDISLLELTSTFYAL